MSYADELAERRRTVLSRLAPEASSMFGAHALFGTDVADAATRAEGIVAAQFGELSASPFAVAQAGCFDTFAAMFLYCRWHDELTATTTEHIRRVMSRNVHGRGNTENHWLMHYTAQLLAVERFPGIDVWWNGLPPARMHAEAQRWILGTIERTARIGHHEYDSTHYHGWHVLPMICLADHAADATLRRRAADMATLLVADMALEHFHGAWAGGHAREGYRENTWTCAGSSAGLIYYYFGTPGQVGPLQAQQAMAPALTAAWTPPPMLNAIAHDRAAPRTVRKTKAPRTLYRHVPGDSLPVRKTTFTSRSFALGTTQLGLPGAPGGPIDLVTWDLTWDGPKHEAKVTSGHPYIDPGRFSAFLSELPQDIGRAVPAAKPFLQFPDRLSGASPYERMVQHEGAALVVYRIPADDAHPWTNVYLPRSTTWRQAGAVVCGDTGSFYLRLRPIGAVRWDSVQDADYIDGWYLRLTGEVTGVFLEAVEKDGYADFDAFAAAATAADPVDLAAWDAAATVGADTLTGHRLELAWDGAHRVDGVTLDYAAWKLYDAPEATAEMDGGIVRFEHGGASLTLDFGVDPARPLIPMRVIG